ncbi:MAG TPA: glycosyltransferase family 39 protein, partial [bacterium]|nr:glycosyltransferase family 39 protein [bacterium]
MQNDDWNRTTSIVRFLSGDTSLLQVTSTTFYTQGILGYLFSMFFGWQKLPYLTFIISVLNFYIFAKILSDHFNQSKIKSSIISLIFFFTPLHIYSSIGFMTENYTMFFMLIAIYFLQSYEKGGQKKDFLIFNLAGVLSFFTKQNGIIINFAYIPYLLFKKRYKEAFVQTFVIGLLFSYYFFLFPRTEGMLDKGFIYENISDWKYAYSLIYGIILVSFSFVLPFVFNFVYEVLVKNKKKLFSLIFIFISAGILFFVLNKYFSPGKISWEEYPYFENTFERTGFFPRSIMGTKYYFKWNYDIFRYWDLGSKIILAMFIPVLLLSKKKVINIYSISAVGYLILMVFTEVFFDRYILPLIPILILFF